MAKTAFFFAGALCLGLVVADVQTARAEGDGFVCTLERTGGDFKGACLVPCLVNALAVDIDGPNTAVSCAAPPRRVEAMLRKSEKGDAWLGTMEGKFPEDPTRFGITDDAKGGGVAKTPYGWFALRSSRLDGERLSLAIVADRQLPPTLDDVKIIQRAQELVADEKVWNRNDDRKCPDNPQKWSVFCALMQATQEISGGVHYRQPALQAVREVLNEVGGKRIDKHRLMDYNNHPDTTLADVQTLLRLSQAWLEKRFR